MNPLERIRIWSRKDFPDPPPGLSLRQLAELETDHDLQKPVQQLICDVHEECLNELPPKVQGESEQHWNERLVVLQLQRLIGAQKRMVSMMGRVALEHERTSNALVKLSWVLVGMTAVLIWLTIVLVWIGK
ncbi:MAG: hypothetical protein DME19_13515 [Verrucomicrobia bacterium]|nr:MAG: hypothetical protein DME19_13515 [Verrucomicrobiota bacterium]